MHGFSLLDMTLKLVVSLILGGLIGWERETHGRPAGLRTHILVCVGATLYTLCSYIIAGKTYDPGRIAAQIVTGIGFLGAGTIIRQGSTIRGLTTAASIWAVAAIGIAVAIGGMMMALAAIASVLVFLTLVLVAGLERRLLSKQDERPITLSVTKEREALSRVLSILAIHGARIRTISSEEGDEQNTQLIRARVRVSPQFDPTELDADLAASRDVISYNWE